MSEPMIVDRATWQAEREALLVREKAHTRAGDAIAAARRRLPMVEMDPAAAVVGPHGPVPDITYATFCQGGYEESVRYRDFVGWDVPWYSARDSGDALLAGRGFAVLACYLRDGHRVFETCWTAGRGLEAMSPSHGLMDTTVHGRKETWEDSPAGWPQRWDVTPEIVRTDGRPTAQWSRLASGVGA